MLKMLKHGAAALVMALTAGAASAGGVLYDCQIKRSDSKAEWVSQRVALMMIEGQGAKVVDAITLDFNGGALDARVKKSGSKLRWRWSVQVKSGTRQRTTMRYNATLNTDNNSIRIVANPRGYTNSFRGQGGCKAFANPTAKTLKRVLRGS